MTDRNQILDQAKRQLEALRQEFEQLQQKIEKEAKELSTEGKKLYEEQSKELRNLLKEAGEKFEAAKNTSEETWQEVKEYVDLTGKALRNSFNYFKSHFRQK